MSGVHEALAGFAALHDQHETFILPVKVEPYFVVGCNSCATGLGPADLRDSLRDAAKAMVDYIEEADPGAHDNCEPSACPVYQLRAALA